jgi:3-oxosteroid 1-dehydrogenase
MTTHRRDVAWDNETDVVVVGAGIGGYTTALSAHARDAEVVILEKADRVGGTSAKSAGGAWIPDNGYMRDAGIADPRQDALRYMARLSRPTRYDPRHPTLGLLEWEFDLIQAFYDHAGEALDFMVSCGALEPEHAPDYPDYYDYLPEDRAPRGRMVFLAGVHEDFRGGERMVATMDRAACEREIPVLTGHRVVDVVRDDGGRVVGVVGHTADRSFAVRARKGVVFATGGFSHDRGLMLRFVPFVYSFGSAAALTNEGDFLRIAEPLGVQLDRMTKVWSSAMIRERVTADPAGVRNTFLLPGGSLLAVNRYGRRVMNERTQFDEWCQVFYRFDPVRLEHPNVPMIAVWDQVVADKDALEALGNPVTSPGVVRGDTIEQLAERLAGKFEEHADLIMRAKLAPDFVAELRRTIARFNELAAKGVDEDFGRGDQAFDFVVDGVYGHPEDPVMRPLRDSGPYYACLLGPGVWETRGGPRADRHGRVISATTGAPIPGLYGVGNCVASAVGDVFWSGGATLGPFLAFGYLAGRHVAGSPAPLGGHHMTRASGAAK